MRGVLGHGPEPEISLIGSITWHSEDADPRAQRQCELVTPGVIVIDFGAGGIRVPKDTHTVLVFCRVTERRAVACAGRIVKTAAELHRERPAEFRIPESQIVVIALDVPAFLHSRDNVHLVLRLQELTRGERTPFQYQEQQEDSI